MTYDQDKVIHNTLISVDMNQARMQVIHWKKIIEKCGRIAVRMSETKLHFEGLVNV